MPQDAGLTLRDETAAVMRCLRESLCEPAFARALAQLVSVNGPDKQCEIAERTSSVALLQKTRADGA